MFEGTPIKMQGHQRSKFVIALAASFGLIFFVLLFVMGPDAENNLSCDSSTFDSSSVVSRVPKSCANCSRTKTNTDTKVETLIEAQCPQVVGNVVGERGADDKTSIFSKSAGYVGFKRHLSAELDQELIERSLWPDERWNEVTVETMRNNTEDGVVIIALSNYGMREITMNWIASLKLNGYKKFVVLCFDFEMYRFLCEHGLESNAALIPGSWFNMKLEVGFVAWGDKRYHAMLHGKILIIIEILKRGFTILHTDVDIVFLNPYVVQHILAEDKDINADFTYMIDNSYGGYDVVNGGFWLARPTELMIDVWNQTFQVSTTDKRNVVDQQALNHVLNNHKKDIRFSRHFRPLSRSLYPCGLYIKKKMTQDLFIYPMVAHANWLVGMAKKKDLFKQLNMWYIKEDFAK